MSLQDQRRYLETIELLTALDRDAGVAVVDVAAALGREAGDLTTATQLTGLWEAQCIVFSEDESYVTITPKGLSVLEEGENPAQPQTGPE